MKVLILVRHAKSDLSASFNTDFERTLNERGRREAPKMAEHLQQSGVIPQRIICSPSRRTHETATIFAEHLGVDVSSIVTISEIYEATSSDLIKVVSNFDNNTECCLLVGHNPGITDFSNYLMNKTAGHIEHVPPAGVVVLKLDVSSWKLLAAQGAELMRFMTPGNN